MNRKKTECEIAEAELDKAMQRFRKRASDHRELVRSLVPPEDREDDTGKFTVPPAAQTPAG